MSKSYEPEGNKLPNIVGTGTKFVGEIDTNGDLRVDGIIEGNIVSKGKIVLGSGGSINGTIKCVSAEISGSFEGKLEVSELLALKNTAYFKGEMKVNKLSIEPGAKFIGTCMMSDDRQPSKPAEQVKK